MDMIIENWAAGKQIVDTAAPYHASLVLLYLLLSNCQWRRTILALALLGCVLAFRLHLPSLVRWMVLMLLICLWRGLAFVYAAAISISCIAYYCAAALLSFISSFRPWSSTSTSTGLSSATVGQPSNSSSTSSSSTDTVNRGPTVNLTLTSIETSTLTLTSTSLWPSLSADVHTSTATNTEIKTASEPETELKRETEQSRSNEEATSTAESRLSAIDDASIANFASPEQNQDDATKVAPASCLNSHSARDKPSAESDSASEARAIIPYREVIMARALFAEFASETMKSLSRHRPETLGWESDFINACTQAFLAGSGEEDVNVPTLDEAKGCIFAGTELRKKLRRLQDSVQEKSMADVVAHLDHAERAVCWFLVWVGELVEGCAAPYECL